MVGAAPVCPPERPRSGVSIRKRHVPIHKSSISIRKGHVPTHKGDVSIRKGHILTRKGGVSIHKRCMLTPKHVCALRRRMRPHGATRAGTQAPPLPTSIKPLCHATFLAFVHRRSLFRQPFLVFVHRQSLFRQPSRAFVHRRTVRWQPDDRLGVNGSERPKHGSAANCLRQSEPWWPQRQQAVSRRWDGSSNRTCRRSR